MQIPKVTTDTFVVVCHKIPSQYTSNMTILARKAIHPYYWKLSFHVTPLFKVSYIMIHDIIICSILSIAGTDY